MARTDILAVHLAILFFGLVARSLAQDDSVIPVGELAEGDRALYERVMVEPTLTCSLERRAVRAPIETYEFLLARLDFTGRIVRRFRMGTYGITSMGPGSFHIDDGEGAVADVRLAHSGPHGEDRTRRLYLATGFFEILDEFRVYGDAVILLDYWPGADGNLETEAVVAFKARNETLDRIGHATQKALRIVVEKKAALFVRAAREASELVASDANRVEERLRDDPRVDPRQLDEFRTAFLE